MRRRTVFTGAAAAAALILGVGAAAAQPIAGSYRAEGRNPDGTAYRGLVTIVEANGIVTVSWEVGNALYSGRGVIEGRVVTVDWGSDAPVIYVIAGNGMLYGTWANGTALERLVPLR